MKFKLISISYNFLCRHLIFNNIKEYNEKIFTKTDSKLVKFLDEIHNEFCTFFEVDIPKPKIFFLENRTEIDEIWGKKTEPWLVGAFRGGVIYIFHPDVFESESSHKAEDFWITLKHEYCHFFYNSITKSHYPLWLNEGLASWMSGKKISKKAEQIDCFLNIFDYFDKIDKGVYLAGQFWVEYLIENFGKEKFIKLIKSLKSEFDEKIFSQVFYRIYGIEFKKQNFFNILN